MASIAQGVVIPQGKIIKIYVGGKGKVPSGKDCVLEEDITLKMSSTFAPLISGGIPNLAKIIAGAIGSFTGKDVPVSFKQFGYQIWQNTDPISFSATIGFYMDVDARTDVYEPSVELLKLPLPTEINDRGGLKAPGPSIMTLFKGEDAPSEGSEDDKDKVLREAFNDLGEKASASISSGETMSLSIGQIFHFDNIIVTGAEPTFSIETDEFGYPIWSKIRLDITTVEIGTANMLQRAKPVSPLGGT